MDTSKEHCIPDRRRWWIFTGGTSVLFLVWLILGGYRWEGYPCYVWNVGMGPRLVFFYAMFGLVIYFSYLLIRVVWVPERFDNTNIVLALVGFVTLRVLISSAMPLLGDEAYHWLWPQNLDWCYYDHGGMLGWVSYPFFLISKSVLAARGGPILLGTVTAILSWSFAKWLTNDRGIANVTLAGLMILPVGLIGTTILFTDTPLAVLWVAGIWTTLLAVRRSSLGWWLATGVIWGLGMNCKFLAVLLIGGLGLYLLIDPQGRRALRTPGPYLALLVTGLVFLPTVVWNARNGWQTFVFHFVARQPMEGVFPSGLISYACRQMLLIGPIFVLWGLIVPPLWAWREHRKGNRVVWALVLTGFLPFFVYVVLRFFRPAEPGGLNWTGPLFPVMVLMLVWSARSGRFGKWWLGGSMLTGAWMGWGIYFVLVGQVFVGPDFLFRQLKPYVAEKRIIKNLIVYFGWYPMGRELDILYERYNRQAPTFVLARTYMYAAQLTQYSTKVPLVLSIGDDSIYGQCFKYWNPRHYRSGQDCLFVAEHQLSPRHVDNLRRSFESVRELEPSERVYQDSLMAPYYHVYYCRNLRGFPAATKSVSTQPTR